jgi:hypothetical protein
MNKQLDDVREEKSVLEDQLAVAEDANVSMICLYRHSNTGSLLFMFLRANWHKLLSDHRHQEP